MKGTDASSCGYNGLNRAFALHDLLRWTQQNPVGGSLGDTGNANRYVCVRDNPVNESDPTGRNALGCVISALIAIGLLYITAGPASGALVGVLGGITDFALATGSFVLGGLLAGFVGLVFLAILLGGFYLLGSECGWWQS